MTFSQLEVTDADARPDRFVAAARDLAGETGSAAFTVSQVTTRAMLSLKAFYRCFSGKDELLLALLAADSRIGADFLDARIGARTGAAAVEAYVTELFAMLSLPGASGYAGVLVREYLRLAEHHDAELRAALAPMLDLLARDLPRSEGRSGPGLARAQPKRDAQIMFGVLLGGIHDVVIGRVTDTDELARHLHRFCTKGVGG